MQLRNGMSFFGAQHIPIDTLEPQQASASRAALVVYRHLLGQPRILLISARRDRSRLTLPGGKVDSHERSLTAAVRETLEEAGVLTDLHRPLGHYEHEKTSGKVYPTKTYVARFAGYQPSHEGRELHWLTLSELSDPSLRVRPAIREQIDQAIETLPAYIAAA